MTDEKQKGEEAARWAKEAHDALAPAGSHKKGSHEYPSPSGPSSRCNTAAPLGHKPTFGHKPTYRKLHE